MEKVIYYNGEIIEVLDELKIDSSDFQKLMQILNDLGFNLKLYKYGK